MKMSDVSLYKAVSQYSAFVPRGDGKYLHHMDASEPISFQHFELSSI